MMHHYHRDCISVKHVCDGVPDCPEKDGFYLYFTVFNRVRKHVTLYLKSIL